MVPDLAVSLALHEVLPVFAFVVRVLAHVVPEYVSLCYSLPIVIECRRVVWRLVRDIWPVVQDC